MRETPDADPAQRTRWNVRDSDATLILALDAGRHASPGTAAAERAAAELGRPLLRLDAREPVARDARASVARLLSALPERCTLNVAGPRQSEAPDAYAASLRLLELLFA